MLNKLLEIKKEINNINENIQAGSAEIEQQIRDQQLLIAQIIDKSKTITIISKIETLLTISKDIFDSYIKELFPVQKELDIISNIKLINQMIDLSNNMLKANSSEYKYIDVTKSLLTLLTLYTQDDFYDSKINNLKMFVDGIEPLESLKRNLKILIQLLNSDINNLNYSQNYVLDEREKTLIASQKKLNENINQINIFRNFLQPYHDKLNELNLVDISKKKQFEDALRLIPNNTPLKEKLKKINETITELDEIQKFTTSKITEFIEFIPTIYPEIQLNENFRILKFIYIGNYFEINKLHDLINSKIEYTQEKFEAINNKLIIIMTSLNNLLDDILKIENIEIFFSIIDFPIYLKTSIKILDYLINKYEDPNVLYDNNQISEMQNDIDKINVSIRNNLDYNNDSLYLSKLQEANYLIGEQLKLFSRFLILPNILDIQGNKAKLEIYTKLCLPITATIIETIGNCKNLIDDIINSVKQYLKFTYKYIDLPLLEQITENLTKIEIFKVISNTPINTYEFNEISLLGNEPFIDIIETFKHLD
jgi:hypothetical protein